MRWYVRRLEDGRYDGPNWGPSTEYIEVDDDGWANRQVEIYDNGRTLKYDRGHWVDFHGELFDRPLAGDRVAGKPCPADEFEAVWDSASASSSLVLLSRGTGSWPLARLAPCHETPGPC
jgi:hypothetical protein